MPTPVLTFHVVRIAPNQWIVRCSGFNGTKHLRRKDALEEAYQHRDRMHPTARIRVTGDRAK